MGEDLLKDAKNFGMEEMKFTQRKTGEVQLVMTSAMSFDQDSSCKLSEKLKADSWQPR